MVKKGRKLKKGFTVFRRSDSGSYAVRFTLEGYPQFRIGLGTFDKVEANELAERKYLETSILAERQLLTGDASFDKLAREYVELQFKDGEKNPKRLGHAKHASSTIENYLIPYFGNKPITTIYHNDLMDYLDWRKIYWTEGECKDLDV